MATYLRDPIISYARRSAPSMCGRNSVFAPLLVTISALHSVCSNQPVTMHVGQSAVRSGATGFVANCRLRFAHSSSSLSPNPAAAATRRAVPQKARRAEFSMSSDTSRPLIAFPGGGIYFWWQAGAVKALQKRCDLSRYTMAGASAGSLSAVMAATNVDMDNAFDVALRLSEENGVWTRKEGLAGIWGPMIYQWLDECLPDDAADICNERVAVSVCHLRPSILPLKRKSYDRFATKKDVIEACMASVHIPFFLDGKVSRWFKGEAYVDGSFTFLLRNKVWHVKAGETQPLFLVHHKMDKDLMAKEWGFLETISPASFKEMFDLGEASMTQMIQQGDLFLPADARGRGDELII